MSIRELSVHAAHTDALWSVSWPAPGTTLLTGGVDETLKVWTVSAEEGVGIKVEPKPRAVASAQVMLSAAQQAEGHALPVSASLSLLSVLAVPNSTLVATSSMDGLIRLYDVEKGAHVRQMDSSAALDSWTLCVDPTGSFLATGTRSGSVCVFSVATGEKLGTLLAERPKEGEAASAWVMSVAWSRDGRHLAAGHFDGRVSLWSMRGAAALAPAKPLSPHGKAVRALAFAADSSLLFTGGDDMHVHWYDVASPSAGAEPLHDLYAHSSWVTAIDVPFSSSDASPAAGGSIAAAAQAAAVSPLAPVSFATVSTDRRLKVWSLATRECIATQELDSAGWSVRYDPTGEKVAVGTEQGNLTICQVPTQ